MSKQLTSILRGRAYTLLSATGLTNTMAQRLGHKDAFHQLMVEHDSNAAAWFYEMLPTVLSEAERKVLLDGLAAQYTDSNSFREYMQGVCDDI